MKRKIDIEFIYQTALGNFAKYGRRKTTLEDIANDLGVTNSNLYRYTKSKDSLYHESVAYALQRWQDKVVASLEGITDPKEKLLTLCTKAFFYLSEDKVFCEILRNDPNIFPVFSSDDHYTEINEKSIHLLKSIIQEGIKQNQFRDVDEEQIALSFFSIYKMFIIYTYIHPEENFVENLFMQTLDLLFHGLYIG